MTGNRIDLSAAHWRRSSFSNGSGGNCAEIADGLTGIVPVRDSKTSDGAAVIFAARARSAFIGRVKPGS